jgi:hypothetical protein
MTTHATQMIVLRDGEGTFYVISGEALDAGRVPQEQKKALQEALAGDVSGFLFSPFGSFNDSAFQTAFNTLNQSNTASANNVIVGTAVVGNAQLTNQQQSNLGNVSSSQRVRQ